MIIAKIEYCMDFKSGKVKRKDMAKKNAEKKKAKPKIDDPLKQYVILNARTMKTPPGRFLFVPVDTEDTANRMCWAIGLAAYADALKVFGRGKYAMKVVELAAEIVNDTKMKHPELFRKVAEGPNAGKTHNRTARQKSS